VLANLTENALRHGAGGTVTIAVRRDGNGAVLTVSDEGPGIAAADQARLFDRFWRGDGARVIDGSGLGLAIVREIVAAHGGDVGVESAPGAGATFRVRLPASANRQE
jgi:signal transduction histidine kinase